MPFVPSVPSLRREAAPSGLRVGLTDEPPASLRGALARGAEVGWWYPRGVEPALLLSAVAQVALASPPPCGLTHPAVLEISEVTSGWHYDAETLGGSFQVGGTTRHQLSCEPGGQLKIVHLQRQGEAWVPLGAPVLLAPGLPLASVLPGWVSPPVESGSWELRTDRGRLSCVVTVRPKAPDGTTWEVRGGCTTRSIPGELQLRGLFWLDPAVGGLYLGEFRVASSWEEEAPPGEVAPEGMPGIGPSWSYDHTLVVVRYVVGS